LIQDQSDFSLIVKNFPNASELIIPRRDRDSAEVSMEGFMPIWGMPPYPIKNTPFVEGYAPQDNTMLRKWLGVVEMIEDLSNHTRLICCCTSVESGLA
jgi:hypothetical protein